MAKAVAPEAGVFSFASPMALRTALQVASLAIVLEMVPIVNLLAPVLGGFTAVLLYQRRTGHTLNAGEGAKLGWLTAIFNSLLFTVLFSVIFAISGPTTFDKVLDQMKRQSASPAQQQAFQEAIHDPVLLASSVLLMWLVMFGVCSLLYIAGGALGARSRKTNVS